MPLKLSIFLFVIIGVAIFAPLVVLTPEFVWFRPSGVVYIEGSPLDKAKPVTFYMSSGAREALYLEVTYSNTEEIQIRVEEFSDVLQLFTWNNKPIRAPYVWSEKANRDYRTFWRLEVISPEQSGIYEINLHITLRNWMLSQTYEYALFISTEPCEKPLSS